MRIGIDASPLKSNQRTGIGRFLHRVLEVWSHMEFSDEIYLISHEKIILDFEPPQNWKLVSYQTFSPKGVWYQVLYYYLPKYIHIYKLDVFWGTNFTLPHFLGKTYGFVSIYDLATYKFPEVALKDTLKKIRKHTASSVKRASGIITISKSTAIDIRDIFKVKEDKIFVNYIGGFTVNKKSCHSYEGINPALILDVPYFLFIGTIEPRKNLTTVIEAFNIYKSRTASNAKLILAGKRGWNCDSIYESVEKSPYAQEIVMPGFISDADKAYLLENAKVFLFPSLYEGFGIPILEAFEYRIPVITSKVSSCPEIGGEAAVYIEDLQDALELAMLMENMMNISEKDLEAMTERMIVQLSKFSGINLERQLYSYITKEEM